MIKFFYYQLDSTTVGKGYIVNNIVGYNTRGNSRYKNHKPLPFYETEIIERAYKIKYGFTNSWKKNVRGWYFKKLEQLNALGDDFESVEKEEVKNYLQDKKFMLQFENKLSD